MILAYTDIFNNGKVKKIKATITTEHSASHYGQPVIVLDDGQALDAQSWVLLSYRVVSATKEESPLLEKWLKNTYAMMGMESAASAMGKKGGSQSTPAKSAAAKQRPNLGLAEGRKKLASLTPEQRRENAIKAAKARWKK
jgi:hypothetical protein